MNSGQRRVALSLRVLKQGRLTSRKRQYLPHNQSDDRVKITSIVVVTPPVNRGAKECLPNWKRSQQAQLMLNAIWVDAARNCSPMLRSCAPFLRIVEVLRSNLRVRRNGFAP